VLLLGVLFYILGIALLLLTGNPNLFPTVAMLGNFLVPVTYVAFFYERQHSSRLALPTTAMSFFYGGVLGVFAASVLEPLFIRRFSLSAAFGIGLIEEFAKILGVLVIARHHRHDLELDGLVLGAAAGMGFAALESNGYAFSAFLRSGGSLSVSVAVTLLRGLLSPVGHGTWTAVLASILFREGRAGRFRLNLKVLGAYLMVAVLHGLWDGVPPLMTALVLPGLDIVIAQVIVGGFGLCVLWRRWREANRLQTAQDVAAEGWTLAEPSRERA
jgi:RsiW-degrading membrane proteinase PrsW (M82 family)